VFKSQFGFSLEVDGIDPSYTLGKLEAKKREIRERLRAEGLYGRNRALAAPWDYESVLVVAPERGAGLGDFAKRKHCHEENDTGAAKRRVVPAGLAADDRHFSLEFAHRLSLLRSVKQRV
jgi:hypothetical protein